MQTNGLSTSVLIFLFSERRFLFVLSAHLFTSNWKFMGIRSKDLKKISPLKFFIHELIRLMALVYITVFDRLWSYSTMVICVWDLWKHSVTDFSLNVLNMYSLLELYECRLLYLSYWNTNKNRRLCLNCWKALTIAQIRLSSLKRL